MDYLIPIVFYFFAATIVVSAMGVAFSRNVMYSAFSLLFTFFSVAGMYVLLGGDFLAITQIMVYIGGILILIIFGVMLTQRITGVDMKTGPVGKAQIISGSLISGIVCLTLILVYLNVQWFKQDTNAITPYTANQSQTIKEMVPDSLLSLQQSVTYLSNCPQVAQKINLPDSLKVESSITLIGKGLLTEYLLPFEAASVLLLIAAIGAALIARRKKGL